MASFRRRDLNLTLCHFFLLREMGKIPPITTIQASYSHRSGVMNYNRLTYSFGASHVKRRTVTVLRIPAITILPPVELGSIRASESGFKASEGLEVDGGGPNH
jgi:hypothetical protein